MSVARDPLTGEVLPEVAPKAADEAPALLERSGLIRRARRVLLASAAVLLLLDLVVSKHVYYAIEDTFAFYPLLGAAGAVAIVAAGWLVRALLARPEEAGDG